MRCPRCGAKSGVVNTAYHPLGRTVTAALEEGPQWGYVRRERRCPACKLVFYTVEEPIGVEEERP